MPLTRVDKVLAKSKIPDPEHLKNSNEGIKLALKIQTEKLMYWKRSHSCTCIFFMYMHCSLHKPSSHHSKISYNRNSYVIYKHIICIYTFVCCLWLFIIFLFLIIIFLIS